MIFFLIMIFSVASRLELNINTYWCLKVLYHEHCMLQSSLDRPQTHIGKWPGCIGVQESTFDCLIMTRHCLLFSSLFIGKGVHHARGRSRTFHEA